MPGPVSRAVLDAAMTEAQLFESVRDHLNAFGWLWYHTYDSRRSNGGFPDIFAVNLRQKRAIAIELKREKGKVSDEQYHWMGALAVAGIMPHIWRPSDLSEGAVERVLRGSL